LLLLALLAGSCGRDAPSPPVIDDLRAHDIDAATIQRIEAAVEAVEAAPDAWMGWLDLGMQYHANEMLTQAIPCYEQAGVLAPDEARPYYYLAQSLATSGELAGGVANMRRAAALAEEFAPAHWRLGLLLLESDDASAAVPEFERAIELDPSDRVGWVGLARVALQAGRPEQALEALERAAALPGHNDGYVQRLLGTTYARLGRTAEAERALARGGTWSPYWPDPWMTAVEDLRASVGYRNLVGQQMISAGRAEEGVSVLEALRRDYPDEVSTLTLLNLGVGYRMLERYDEAIETFETVLETLPRNVHTHENLARVQLRKARTADPVTASRLRRSAQEHVNRALELAPRSALAHGLNGGLLAADQRYADAAREYRLAFDYEPRQPTWAVTAARMYWRLEDWQAVVELLEQVRRLTPDNAEVWYKLGVARMRMGHLEAADEALQRAAGLAPDDQAVRQALAELARLRGSSR
jgi:tetratricopeptide (TPR) repeat protein